MKKTSLFILFFFLSTPCFAQKNIEEYYLPDMRYTKRCPANKYFARMIGFPDNPPFSWNHAILGDGGRPIFIMQGLGFDLANTVIDRIGTIPRSTHVLYQYDLSRSLISKNEVDLLTTTYYHKDDLKNIYYVYPAYISNPIVVMTLKKNPAEKDINKFIGKKGAISDSEELFETLTGIYINLTLQRAKDYKSALLMLHNGDVDYLLTGLYTAEAQTRRFRVDDQIVLSEPFTHVKVFMVLSEQSCLAEFKDAFRESFTKWTDGEDKTIRNALFRNIDLYAQQKRVGRSLFAPKRTKLQQLIETKENEFQ